MFAVGSSISASISSSFTSLPPLLRESYNAACNDILFYQSTARGRNDGKPGMMQVAALPAKPDAALHDVMIHQQFLWLVVMMFGYHILRFAMAVQEEVTDGIWWEQ